MLLTVFLFIVGLILLIKGGDWFVDGATGIARRFHIPDLLIGATVVSIGTTLPEVMVSSTSALKGFGEIAYGNAIGSVICNTALISAITLAIKPGKMDSKTLRLPVVFFFFTAIIYAIASYLFAEFSRWLGIILLIIFCIYIGTNIHQVKTLPTLTDAQTNEDDTPIWKLILLLVLGAAFIAVGADFLVDNGEKIAEGLGVPQSVIALTFVALGTSLPELVTAITSLIKGHGDLSLGNIIGANFFNLALVSGVSVTLSPFALPSSKLIAGHNASLVVDLPIMFAVMLLLTLPPLLKSKTYRAQGIILLIIYASYCAFQFIN